LATTEKQQLSLLGLYNRDKSQGANRVTGIIVNRERETLNMDGNITIYVVGGLQGTRNTHIRKDDVEKGITIMKSEVNIMEPPQSNFKARRKKKKRKKIKNRIRDELLLYRLNLECSRET
jgi:hypothetical protein